MRKFLARLKQRRFAKTRGRGGVVGRELRHPVSAGFTPQFRWVFYATGYLSAYTGFLLLFFFRKEVDFFPLLRQILVKSHIVGVAIWLFTCGMLFSIHVLPQLRSRMVAGRKSGITLIILLVIMSLTGYGIQVMPTAIGIDLSRFSHLFTGIAFCLLFAAHLALVKPALRVVLASATLVSLLVAAPFFFLKIENTFPDEIHLNPVGGDIPALRGTAGPLARKPAGADTSASGVKKN